MEMDVKQGSSMRELSAEEIKQVSGGDWLHVTINVGTTGVGISGAGAPGAGAGGAGFGGIGIGGAGIAG